jgi:hypothetical protein
MAPKTARAAMVMPTPTTMMTVEWPKEKKNPVPSGRLPSAISLRVVLSIQEMWSASKACRNPRNHAVMATPNPTPRPLVPPTPVVEVARHHAPDEDRPARDVAGQDEAEHRRQPAPLAGGKRRPDRLEA